MRKLAFRMGFDPERVWNHPANEEMRKKRKPNILCPGDVLYIPEEPARGLQVNAGTTNEFVAAVPRARIHLVFTGSTGPMANEPYVIRGFAVAEGTTGVDGAVAFDVPVIVPEFTIEFPRRNLRHHVRVGHMDPVDEDSGIAKRLQHLGFLSWTQEGDAATQRADALRLFQESVGLPSSGAADERTKAMLLERHGS